MQRLRRVVFIVAPEQRALFDSLSRTFKGDATVQVVLDRRTGERRRGAGAAATDRRRKDRRRRNPDFQRKLAERGYAVVGVLVAKSPRRTPS
jgi:hypothetical protein